MPDRIGFRAPRIRFVLAVLFVLFLNLIFSPYAYSSPVTFTYQEVFQLPWGKADGSAGIIKDPGENFGPQSFAVDKKHGNFSILDTGNSRVSVFDIEGRLLSQVRIGERADDLCLGDRNNFFVLYRRQVIEYDLKGKSLGTYDISGNNFVVTGIVCNGHGNLFYVTDDNESFPLLKGNVKTNQDKQAKGKRNGVIAGDEAYYAELAGQGSAMVTIRSLDGKIAKKIQVLPIDKKIVYVGMIGIDKESNIYITTQESANITEVTRRLLKYDRNGELLAEGIIPYSGYVFTFQDLRLYSDGSVFQMLPMKKEVKILRWNVMEVSYKSSTAGPDLFADSKARAEDFLPGDIGQLLPEENSIPLAAGKTDRDTVMNLSSVYASWTSVIKQKNVTLATNCPKKKAALVTPMRHQGAKQGIPYNWGGDSTPTDYENGLNQGKKAGNICTCDKCFSTNAVGVDCSGFVSRAWEVAPYQHHTTTTLPSISTYLGYSYVDDLYRGDIVLSQANRHVRLAKTTKPSGAVECYESAMSCNVDGMGAGVCISSYSPSDLLSKSYYIYKCDLCEFKAKGTISTTSAEIVQHDPVVTFTKLSGPQEPVPNADTPWYVGPNGWLADIDLDRFQNGSTYRVTVTVPGCSGCKVENTTDKKDYIDFSDDSTPLDFTVTGDMTAAFGCTTATGYTSTNQGGSWTSCSPFQVWNCSCSVSPGVQLIYRDGAWIPETNSYTNWPCPNTAEEWVWDDVCDVTVTLSNSGFLTQTYASTPGGYRVREPLELHNILKRNRLQKS